MIQAVIVRRGETPIALILHEPESGRLVYRGDHTTALYQAFQSLQGKNLVGHVPMGSYCTRRIILPADGSYLMAIATKLQTMTLKISAVFSVTATSLDAASDILAQRYLSDASHVQEAGSITPTGSPVHAGGAGAEPAEGPAGPPA